MIAALVANDTEQVQAVEMMRMYGDNLPVDGLGFGQQACLVKGQCLSKGCREIGRDGCRRRGSSQLTFATLVVRSRVGFAFHDRITTNLSRSTRPPEGS